MHESHKPHSCELCGRRVSLLTRHHLIPRTRHANKRNKRDFERKEVKHRIAWLCRANGSSPGFAKSPQTSGRRATISGGKT